MIYRLQRKFILISAISLFLVIVLVFFLITALAVSSMNSAMDTLTDSVSMGGGRFPDHFGDFGAPGHKHDGGDDFAYITPETRFSTRYFSVWYNAGGQVIRVDAEAIHSVTEEMAVEYAEQVLSGKERGWLENYRYRVIDGKDGPAVVFVDGSVNRATLLQTTVITAGVLLGLLVLALIIVVVLSKRVMKPVAESYEKQKQFVTDANHELKTPLTLILTNLDILEGEMGKNEWLDDIRSEGQRMAYLVDQLVALSRMDEEGQQPVVCSLAVSDIVEDVVSEFLPLAESEGLTLSSDIEQGLVCNGDETLIRRLIAILLDNAVKYCDEGGDISVSLKRGRGVVLTVENSYKAVDGVELDRLFDRFYRADRSRTYTGGYGIGLSIASSIASKHRGEISAYKKNGERIGFRAVLK